jgi:hypothetical protein
MSVGNMGKRASRGVLHGLIGGYHGFIDGQSLVYLVYTK